MAFLTSGIYKLAAALGFTAGLVSLTACSITPTTDIPRETSIDLNRFMGDWYVIAHIPPSQTENAYNSIETYNLKEPDVIETTYTYRDGSFNGTQEIMRPTGYVVADSGDAVWAMEFIWPIKLEYVIAYVDDDYQTTIVGRSKRDYMWLMSRKPIMPDAEYDKMMTKIAALGYDLNNVRKVPQQPLNQR